MDTRHRPYRTGTCTQQTRDGDPSMDDGLTRSTHGGTRFSSARHRLADHLRASDHWERLTTFDTEMLGHERLAPHISADCPWLLIYRGRCPTPEEFRRHVAARLHALPKLRAKLAFSPIAAARPLWVPDGDFDLDRHIGVLDEQRYRGHEGWLRYIGEALEVPLDKARPLWRLELAPDLGDGTFAVIFRHHHSLADGQSGLVILRALLADPPADASANSSEAATAASLGRPGTLALMWRDATGLLRAARRTGRALRRPYGELLRSVRESALALGELLRMFILDPPPPRLKALNQPLGPPRRAAHMTVPLNEVGTISRVFGCFPNEIYLATLAGALRRYLTTHGVKVGALPAVRAGMLINIGGQRDPMRLGNQISGIAVDLPVAQQDPLSRLRAIQASTLRIRTTRLVTGFEVLNRVTSVLPARLITQVARLTVSPQISINTIASHMVAPRRLRSFAGCQLERLHSWTFLPAGHTMSFVCHTFAGAVTINLLAEPDLVDVESLCDDLHAAHHELLDACFSREPMREIS